MGPNEIPGVRALCPTLIRGSGAAMSLCSQQRRKVIAGAVEDVCGVWEEKGGTDGLAGIFCWEKGAF